MRYRLPTVAARPVGLLAPLPRCLGYGLLALGLLALGRSAAAPRAARPPGPAWVAPAALPDSLQAQPRPVLVFIGASWCPYCHLQEATTFRDPAVLAQLRSCYCVHLDAESRVPLTWGSQRYEFAPTGPGIGLHELARALGTAGPAPLSFPTTVLLDAQLRVLGRWPGLLRPRDLLPVLAALPPAR